MASKKVKARRAAAALKKQPLASQSSASGTQGEQPLFCFRHVDKRTANAWAFDPHAEHSGVLVSFICDMAQLSWSEIERQETGGERRRRKHHSQSISTLATGAQDDIKRSKLDETFGDEMFRFRLAGTQRLWGFRRGRVFHAVWWDHEHRVYPTDP